MNFTNSMEIYDDALDYIPMGTSTFSRNPNFFVIGASPLYISNAEGCKIIDVDGNEFIDYSMSLSIVILGYNNAEVNKAAISGINDGLIYTLSCPEEVELAKRITEIIPCAEMVRFLKSGSDSCEGAVRLARNYTNKLKVITVGGYHGFHDWFIASTPRNKGIPKVMSEWVLPHAYNDIEAIEKTIKTQSTEIAALIMEPLINYEPRKGFLESIRKLTEENNIILIFDEMKTGFRLDLGGAQKYFNVIPDLAIFGKGLANGFPLSALVGKKYLMKQFEDENCFLSASYATEKASIKASLKTIKILKREKVLEHVWEMGEMLKEGTNNILSKYGLNNIIKIVGLAPMSHFIISDYGDISVNEIKSFIQQESVERGVLFVGYNHTSFAHTIDDIEYTLKVYDEVFSLLDKALKDKSIKVKLKGRPISAFGVRDGD